MKTLRFCVLPCALVLAASVASPIRAQVGGDAADSESYELPAMDPKVVTAQAVYDRLAQRMGMPSPPPLRVGSTQYDVAEYDPRRLVIGLEEEYYDIARDFGPDSLDVLAFMLGHELGHFHRGHNRGGHFWGVSGARQPANHVLEREADEYGVFFGHVAGFDVLAVADPFLARYYGPGRETERRRRAQILEDVGDRLRPITRAFDAGVWLLALEPYVYERKAAFLFDFIGHRFPSPEILNNAGVAYLKQALALHRQLDTTPSFDYPVQLDVTTTLRSRYAFPPAPPPPPPPPPPYDPEEERRRAEAERREREERTRERDRLLEHARNRFAQAVARQPDYLPGLINLAIAHDMTGRTRRAYVDALEAFEIAAIPELRASAAILVGIVMVQVNDMEQALERFRYAAEVPGYCELAVENLRQAGEAEAADSLEGEHDHCRQERIAVPDLVIEEVGGIDADEVADFLMTAPGVERVCLPTIECPSEDGFDHARDLEIRHFDAVDHESFLVRGLTAFPLSVRATRPDYRDATARGVRIGDDMGAVRDAYGTPERVALAGGRSYYVYGYEQIAFIIDNGVVHGWAIFSF